MDIESFYLLKNFHVTEKDIYGRLITEDLDRIEEQLMIKVDAMVSTAKESFGTDVGKFIVHSIVSGGHTPGSKHYSGEAIDGHFTGLNLYQAVMVGLKAGFRGIGYYPWWGSPGIHVDIRSQAHTSVWASFSSGAYEYDYGAVVERLLMYADF